MKKLTIIVASVLFMTVVFSEQYFGAVCNTCTTRLEYMTDANRYAEENNLPQGSHIITVNNMDNESHVMVELEIYTLDNGETEILINETSTGGIVEGEVNYDPNEPGADEYNLDPHGGGNGQGSGGGAGSEGGEDGGSSGGGVGAGGGSIGGPDPCDVRDCQVIIKQE